MRINYSKVTLFLTFFFSITTLFAQQSTAVSNYDYQEAFAPLFYTKNGTDTRSASGQPGANSSP